VVVDHDTVLVRVHVLAEVVDRAVIALGEIVEGLLE
jgi:hypothetical protein